MKSTRCAGLALVAAALCAAAGLAAPVSSGVPAGTAAASASASPSPSPAAVARNQRTAPGPRGGPLNFSLTGAMTVGERSYSTQSADGSGGAYNQGTSNAGLLFQMARRTPTTSLTFGVPLGVSSGQRALFGQVQAIYSTPHYGLAYMPQPLGALGVAPVGATASAFAFTTPLRGGDLSVIGGSALLGFNQTPARIYGVRARSLLGRKLIELAYFRARTKDGQIQSDTLIGGFATASAKFDSIWEGAYQRNHTAFGDYNGHTFVYRLDYGSNSTYSTFTLSHQSNGFLSAGGGPLIADDRASAGYRISEGFGSVSLDEAFERMGTGDSRSFSRQGSLLFDRTFGANGMYTGSLSLTDQRSSSAFGVTWIGSAGVQLGATLDGFSSLFGVQESRSTVNYGAPLSIATYQSTVQKQFGLYSAQVSYQYSRQATLGAFDDVGTTLFSFGRQWGPTSVFLSNALTRTISNNSNAVQLTPLLTVSRRISPVTTVGLTFGEQTMRDVLNPSANGRTRIFSLQISTPFAFGSGIVQGHVNPRLPASIAGTVSSDFGGQGALSNVVSSGLGNVLVVLDNAVTQRTDLSGRFQFNFVPPGHHTVRLDLASLPRGVTPDQPLASVDVQGGQQAALYFQVGTYGALTGYVYARDASGNLLPVPNASVTLDKAGVATTDAQGQYAFGRMTSGQHTVALQIGSLPATVNISPQEATKKISVANGQIARLDFVANPLGSLAGRVVFDKSLAPQYAGPVKDAYVVAEPGDYAAITDDDGTFILDNLPAGTYTLNLDPDTLPDDTGSASPAQSVTLAGNEHIEGLHFTVGEKQKPVVFSLRGSESVASLALRDSALPPGGATEVSVDAGAGAKSVTVNAFGQSLPLRYDAPRKKWIGMLDVPPTAAAKPTTIVADVTGSRQAEASATLDVRASMPIVTFSMTPRRPARGQYVTVRARFLADVHPGDEIHWSDNQITKLTNRITGRVYEFTVKISIQPMTGMLLTRQGRLPIILR